MATAKLLQRKVLLVILESEKRSCPSEIAREDVFREPCHSQTSHLAFSGTRVRVNSVDPALAVRKREGAGAARDRFAPVKKEPAPKHPLKLVQIDHTLADIMVVDEVERRSIGRPWLTLVIDVATRVILGYRDLHKRIASLVDFRHPAHHAGRLMKPVRKTRDALIVEE